MRSSSQCRLADKSPRRMNERQKGMARMNRRLSQTAKAKRWNHRENTARAETKGNPIQVVHTGAEDRTLFITRNASTVITVTSLSTEIRARGAGSDKHIIRTAAVNAIASLLNVTIRAQCSTTRTCICLHNLTIGSAARVNRRTHCISWSVELTIRTARIDRHARIALFTCNETATVSYEWVKKPETTEFQISARNTNERWNQDKRDEKRKTKARVEISS